MLGERDFMPVYFDHNATTHLDPQVLEAMLPYLSGPSANASSLHRFGRMARDAVERARAQLACALGCEADEIIWTSGGTEADNLAVKGATTPDGRVLYGATEHPAVMEAADSLGAVRAASIAVDAQGVICLASLQQELAAGAQLISVMCANNETGVIQELAPIAKRARAAGALLHVDAVQALGKLPLSLQDMGCDLLSVSAHKIYGPKGCGALVVRNHTDLKAIIHGGAQEGTLRGGTENVAAIVGFGEAAQIAARELDSRAHHCLQLRQRLEQGLKQMDGALIFGEASPRLPNTVQFAVPGWEGEALLMALDRKGFAVSSGSACASGSGEPSHVLTAMGYDRDTAKGAVRVSLGKDNRAQQVDDFLAALRALQP